MEDAEEWRKRCVQEQEHREKERDEWRSVEDRNRRVDRWNAYTEMFDNKLHESEAQCYQIVKEYDDAFVIAWKEELDNLLVFVGHIISLPTQCD